MAFTFYVGHDNALEWALQIQRLNCVDEYYDADGATRFVIHLDDADETVIDSDIEADVFGTIPVLLGTTSVVALSIKLGLAANIPTGTFRMRLVVYSLDYPNGVVWQNNIPIVIKE